MSGKLDCITCKYDATVHDNSFCWLKAEIVGEYINEFYTNHSVLNNRFMGLNPCKFHTPKETCEEITEKERLLKHYATGDIHQFIQLDGRTVGVPYTYDGLDRTDKDGDNVTAIGSTELRHHSSELAVRVSIHEGTSHEDAVRLLKKMVTWLEIDPSLVLFETFMVPWRKDAELPPPRRIALYEPKEAEGQ